MESKSNPTSSEFPKRDRLSSKKKIKELFDKGSSFYLHPLKVIYLRQPSPAEQHQVLISVPKKLFKKAVDRNLIKRRIRESYRRNKHLLESKEIYLFIGYIYIGKEIADYTKIDNKLKESLQRLNSITQE